MQAKLFNDPKSGFDVLVASDAVGMGLNLSIGRIVFSTLQKFDGRTRRRLSSQVLLPLLPISPSLPIYIRCRCRCVGSPFCGYWLYILSSLVSISCRFRYDDDCTLPSYPPSTTLYRR